MKFRSYGLFLLISLVIFIPGCIPPPEEWEDIESDYDHVLNVLGIVSLDSDVSSFIGLYRTTDLGDISQLFVGVDTIWYDDDYFYLDSIYEPAALIKDAIVQLSDGVNTYDFSFVESEEFYDTTLVNILGVDVAVVDTFNIRMNYYKDTTDTFHPQTGVTYQLTINSPNYDSVIGELTTPHFPVLIDSLIQDTISSRELYKIFWEKWDDSTRGFLSGNILGSDDFWGGGSWCRSDFQRVVDLSDSLYTVPTEFCDETSESTETADYFIRLTAMDDNYYSYFVKGETEDYSNFLLNSSTTKGRSVGIEGGFGVFGAIASDAILKVILSD